MLIGNQHPMNKSLTVAVLGAPNVGKSSLINYLLGFDLSIVSPKPQTTRNKFMCIFSIDRTEIILIDTPGLHRSGQEFNKRLNAQATEGAENADLNLLLIDLTKDAVLQAKEFRSLVGSKLNRTWIIFTKKDLISDLDALNLDGVFASIKEIIPETNRFFSVSSTSGDDMHLLTGGLCDIAPSSPHHYDEGSISNKSERFFVAEYIREQVFKFLQDELPYEIAVTIDEFKDFEKEGKRTAHISATIHVNKPSQRAIVVGTKGQMIKQIGMNARERIEKMIEGHVFLNLHAKVSPRWYNNNYILEEIGLPRTQTSRRVWRKK